MIITPTDNLENINLGKFWKVFLAGPIQGAPEWQFDVPEFDNVLWISPRRKNYKHFDYNHQVDWETKMMNLADFILFWIPEKIEDTPGRDYAQTTRTEFGEYLALGKKIIFGCYEGFPGEKYFLNKLNQYQNTDNMIYRSLMECVGSVKVYIGIAENFPIAWFTSDTHFGDDIALTLSKRPFKSVNEMDRTMIRNWNNTVKPNDTVYHLGDFGKDSSITSQLNGKIILLYGNYERDRKYVINENDFDEVYSNPFSFLDENKKYLLCHEPLTYTDLNNEEYDGCIFGHIHGGQKIKDFPGVDCGMDANNYKPISIDDINFYMFAVDNGFYDDNVWVSNSDHRKQRGR